MIEIAEGCIFLHKKSKNLISNTRARRNRKAGRVGVENAKKKGNNEKMILAR
jgi:hypothetical protein